MSKNDPPCYGCTAETGRKPGCHGYCEAYLQWKNGILSEDKKQEHMERILSEISNRRYKRRKKRAHLRKKI